MLRYGEEHEALGEEQHGSRQSCMAIDAVMLKVLTYDNSRTYRSDLLTMDNDANSCYNRILISLAMLPSRRLGMLASVSRSHALTLQNMLHRLRTSHGVSDDAYSALREELCDIGQGSGAGPAIWVAISIVLIACYKDTEFADPAQLKHTERWLGAFVDDAELGQNDFWNEPQRWGRLLFTSGGALELPKCSWYCLHWLWDADGIEHTEICNQHGPELSTVAEESHQGAIKNWMGTYVTRISKHGMDSSIQYPFTQRHEKQHHHRLEQANCQLPMDLCI
jgi:hypothetical protein